MIEIGNKKIGNKKNSSLRRHPTDIKTFLSGSFDGGVRVWNVANRQTKWSLTAHDACVRGDFFFEFFEIFGMFFQLFK